jgi:hypothetical protein
MVHVQDVPDPLEDASQLRGEHGWASHAGSQFSASPIGVDVPGKLGVHLRDLLILASDLVLLELVLESLEREVRGIALILGNDYVQLEHLQGSTP